MWAMLQQDQPDDFVIATGKTHSVREFLEATFSCVGLNWRDHVEIDPKYYRPAEVDSLVGDASKAKRILQWEPKTTFDDLVLLMVDADRAMIGRKEQHEIFGDARWLSEVPIPVL